MKYYNSSSFTEVDHNIKLPLSDENKILNYFDFDSSFIYKIKKLGIWFENDTERITKLGNYLTNCFPYLNRKIIEKDIYKEINRIILLKNLTKNTKEKLEEFEKTWKIK